MGLAFSSLQLGGDRIFMKWFYLILRLCFCPHKYTSIGEKITKSVSKGGVFVTVGYRYPLRCVRCGRYRIEEIDA